MSKKYPGGFISKNPVAPAGPYETSAASGVWTLSQAAYWQKQGLWPVVGNVAPPTVIGQAYGGGFYAGQIGVGGVATHYLIVGPVASAQSTLAYKNAQTATTGADSVIDGPQNTADMVAGGSSTVYPAAHFCNDLAIGGFSDWYMPSNNELEVCYYNLKPTTQNNTTDVGINTNAVPSRGSTYTTGTPAQTSATVFQTGNAEAFTADQYAASTETANALYSWLIVFTSGNTSYSPKNNSRLTRAVRRVAV